jgi:F-type H+-transporting ATPase subunit gamma
VRQTEVSARLRSLSELSDVVGALRSVSVARVRQARERLGSIRQYTGVLQRALGDACRASGVAGWTPPTNGRRVVVAFGSDRGFVGAFNERILARAAKHRRAGDELLVVGTRAVLASRERGEWVDWSSPTAVHLDGIDDVALRIAEELGRGGTLTPTSSALLVYVRHPAEEVVETLLPLDLHVYGVPNSDELPPLANIPPEKLAVGLVDEMLFAQLERALTESFASENAARLATMQAASDSIARKLEVLRRVEHEVRQEEITTELLDVVVGVEAVSS